MSEKTRSAGATDVAALSASIAAAVITLVVGEGQFGIANLLLSVTLALTLVAFVGPHHRGRLERAALAASAGMIALPGAGYVAEKLARADATPSIARVQEAEMTGSAVLDTDLAIIWGVVFALAYAIDAYAHRRRSA